MDNINTCIGKAIKTMDLTNDQVRITFTDGARLLIEDVANLCCEQRYIESDDNLQLYEGATFTGLEIKDGDGVDSGDDYNVVDCQFLEVNTDKGFTTFKAYNIHNGYYSGFDIRCTITEGDAHLG